MTYSHPKTVDSDRYAPECWRSEKRYYSLCRNGFGHWWPHLKVKGNYGGGWMDITIRDSNPFKTLKGAIAFVEKYIERDKAEGHIFGVLETGTVEQFEKAAKSGQVISLCGFIDAIENERKASPVVTVEPEPDFIETPIPLAIEEPPIEDVWCESIEVEAIAIDDSAIAIEAARESFQKLLAPAAEVVEPTIESAVPVFGVEYFASVYKDFQAKRAEPKAAKAVREKTPRQPKAAKVPKTETVEAFLFGRSFSTYVNGKLIKASAADHTAPVKIGSKMQTLILALEESPKTIEEVMEILDWQIHSARAGITDKLRKLGYGFEVVEGKYSLLMPEGATHKFY
jgi:hypothetical protein